MSENLEALFFDKAIQRPALSVFVDHSMTICTHNDKIAKPRFPTLCGSGSQRHHMVDLCVAKPEVPIAGLEIKSTAGHLTN